MFAGKLVKDAIPPLKPTDTCQRALQWMDEFHTRYLPVINGKSYLGLVKETDLVEANAPEALLQTIETPLNRIFVYSNQHVYDVVKFAAIHKCDIVPVLNEKQEYEGLITINDLVEYFAESKSAYMPGGIITLELRFNDFSMSQIAQLIESDGAHILSTSVSATPDPQIIELTIKIDKIDLSRILASFYRYNYNVTASFFQSEFGDDLKNRYESLMNYLSIG
jgi:acetoin utilization protein AcuB